MDDGLITTLARPRIEQGRLLLIVSLGSRNHGPGRRRSGFARGGATPSRRRAAGRVHDGPAGVGSDHATV